jgi:glycosyltransferase involved in cell wall biosynthesis
MNPGNSTEPFRILAITTAHLFPSQARPTAGIFFANLLRRLHPLVERLVVVVPTAYIPGFLQRLPRFSFRRKIARHERWHGLEVFRPPYFSIRSQRHLWFQSRSFCLAATPLCLALHRRHHFNLVLGYGFGPPAHTAHVVASDLRVRSVSWAIGSDVHTYPNLSEENRRLLMHTVHHNTLVLTESDTLRHLLLSYCPDTRNVHTFYKGIDLEGLQDRPDPTTLRAKLGLDAGRTYMLMAGHLAKTKGSEEFYVSFKHLAGKHPRLSALWIGDGPEASAMKHRAQADGLAGRFLITGQVPRSSVIEHMQAADLMLFPSHMEGLPNVVVEALAAGLPTVATDVGGDAEIITHEATGLLVPPQDVPAMIRAVERVLDNPEWARQMGERSRQFVQEHFDVNRNVSRLLQLFQHLASGNTLDHCWASGRGINGPPDGAEHPP